MSDEAEHLRKQAYSLLMIKKSLQNQIKQTEIMLIEESQDATGQTNIEITQSIDQLETAIINASGDLMCFEKALKSAEMNWEMHKHLRLDSTEMPVEASPADKAKQTAALVLILRNNALQTKYLGVVKEIEDLQERVIKKQNESLEVIIEARELKQNLVKVEKEESSTTQDGANLESELARLLQENLQTHRMVASMFQELIFCSKIDYSETLELRSLVLDLAKELELDK